MRVRRQGLPDRARATRKMLLANVQKAFYTQNTDPTPQNL